MTAVLIHQILLAFLFLSLAVFCFYFPGALLLGSRLKKKNFYTQVILSFTLGITLFATLAVTLGMLKIRYLNLPILFILSVLYLKKNKRKSLLPLIRVLKDRYFMLIFFLGLIIMGFINFPSGMRYSLGDLYWSSQGHDGLWHVSLMQSIGKSFPIENPLLPGNLLKNYHFASDIFFGEFYRIFPFFNPLDLYFRFFPILLIFLLGLSTFSLVNFNWGKQSGYWAMIFTFFAGSFGYIYSIMKGGFPLSGETVFWASQGHTIIGNPPHTLGIIWLTTIYTVLSIFLRDKSRDTFWLKIIFFLGFALAILKVSAGMVLIGSVTVGGLYYYLKTKEKSLLFLSGALGISNIIFLKIISPHPGSFLVFEPFWFLRTMMVVKLDNVDWELRRQHYLSIGSVKAWLRIIQLELNAFVIFIVGNSGMRLIGLFAIFKQLLKKRKTIDITIISAIIGPIIFIMLFVQSGIAYNLIQFMQIYLHLLGIYAGVTLGTWIKKQNHNFLKITIPLVIMIFAIPTAIGTLFDFYGPGHNALAKVSNGEIKALTWIKNNTSPNSLILTKPFDKNSHYQYKQQPIPIYAWYSTPYVTVYSNRDVVVSGEEQLKITDYDIDNLIKNNKLFFKAKDLDWNKKYLSTLGVRYIYARKEELDYPLDPDNKYLSIVYQNTDAVVYELKN